MHAGGAYFLSFCYILTRGMHFCPGARTCVCVWAHATQLCPPSPPWCSVHYSKLLTIRLVPTWWCLQGPQTKTNRKWSAEGGERMRKEGRGVLLLFCCHSISLRSTFFPLCAPDGGVGEAFDGGKGWHGERKKTNPAMDKCATSP